MPPDRARSPSPDTLLDEPRRVAARAVPLSGEQRIDGLLAGLSWADRPGEPVSLTYSFPESAAAYPFPYSPLDEPRFGFAPLSAMQRAAVREALQLWSAVADIRFVESDEGSGPATLRFAATGAARTAHAYIPDANAAAGDVWLSTSLPTMAGYAPGSYEFFVLIHEIGHALGLKHPHDRVLYPVRLATADDHLGFSVMSYRAFPGANVNRPFLGDDFPSTPMLGDIAAIQYLYGAATSTNAGDTYYRFEAGEQIWQTLYDTGGTDTIDLSNLADGVRLDLRPGAMSEVGPPADTGGPAQRKTLGIAPGTLIERAIGTDRADLLIGNDAANRLEGRGSNDRIEGGGGDDVLVPGAGNDRVAGGPGIDRVELDGLLADFAIRVKGATLDLRDLRPGAPEGRDRLQSIEVLQFADGPVSVAALTAPRSVPVADASAGLLPDISPDAVPPFG